MPTARSHLATAVVDGKIYAIGGWVPRQMFSTVEIYDPSTDTWHIGADMPTSRWSLSTRAGGVTAPGRDWKTLKTVEVYHPETDSWTRSVNLSSARGWLATRVIKGKIYAIGGSTGDPDWVMLLSVSEFDTGLAVTPQGKLPTEWGG